MTPSPWASALASAIASIPHRPYGYGGTGVTQKLDWNGKILLWPGQCSYCSGAVFEAVVFALKALGMEKVLTADEIKAWRRWCYILDLAKVPEQCGGGAAGMVAMGWADSVALDDCQPGDVAHAQWHPLTKPASGHEIIIIDPARPEGVWTWSSNTKRPKERFAGSPGNPFVQPADFPMKPGHQWYRFTVDPEWRFHIARPKPEWLAQGGVA